MQYVLSEFLKLYKTVNTHSYSYTEKRRRTHAVGDCSGAMASPKATLSRPSRACGGTAWTCLALTCMSNARGTLQEEQSCGGSVVFVAHFRLATGLRISAWRQARRRHRICCAGALKKHLPRAPPSARSTPRSTTSSGYLRVSTYPEYTAPSIFRA